MLNFGTIVTSLDIHLSESTAVEESVPDPTNSTSERRSADSGNSSSSGDTVSLTDTN